MSAHLILHIRRSASSGTSAQPGSPTQTGDPSNATTSKSKSNTGAIVGGVVGGIALLVIAIVALFFFRRRRRGAYDRPAREMLEATAIPYQIEPLLSPRAGPDAQDQTSYHPQSHDQYLTATAAGVTGQQRPHVDSDYRSRSNEKFAAASQTVLTSPSDVHSSSVPTSAPSTVPSQVAANREPPADVVPPTSPGVRALPTPPDPTRHDNVEADIASVPGLVDTINRLLQRLPHGGHAQDEPPPSYGV